MFRKSGNKYDILVESNINTREKLENLAIKSSAVGHKVLLKQIADVKLDAQRSTIKRYDRDRVVTVFSDVNRSTVP
ncbi:MAG: hypothetical protein K9L17_10640 [Clostridiales bacterium]|nr:hypothetical protein [Clostridiales bacterium]MCF8023137.1 hypothetical protein [Clostridiales bacterium]